MIEKSDAIVLHYMPYTETSIIAHVYTREHGRLSIIVPGVRQAKSRNRLAYFMSLNRVWIELDFRPKRELQRLREMGLVSVHHSLHSNIAKNAIGLFVAELLYKALMHEQKNEQLFDFLMAAIDLLETSETGIANFHLVFAVQLTRFLGFFPLNNYDAQQPYFNLRQGSFSAWPGKETLSDTESALFAKLLSCTFTSMHELPLTGELRNGFLMDIMQYYLHHIPNFKGVNAIAMFRELF